MVARNFQWVRKYFRFLNCAELWVVSLPFLVYLNALPSELVFDDSSAIKENQDLRPSTSWSNLFWNDYWGTPMNQERSHKSYRPITVLSFRLNYLIHGLDPLGYHLVNVLLHCMVCYQFFRFCLGYLERDAAFFSTLHFAFHPIHTEAVTGVVGRAELLSAVVFLSIISLYKRVCTLKRLKDITLLAIVSILLFAGTLCKEQCITVVGVLASLSIFKSYWVYVQLSDHLGKPHPKSSSSLWHRITTVSKRSDFGGICLLSFVSVLILYFRCAMMDWKLPHFTEFDNPAAHSPTLVRRLTHLYLVSFNLWLMLFPSGLCADWTLGSIRLITGWLDLRNVATVIGFSLLCLLLMLSFHSKRPYRYCRVLFTALCLMVFPFLPASNLLFPVGFVVAERVVYISSFGLSLLFGLGYQSFAQFLTKQRFRKVALVSRFFRFLPLTLIGIVYLAFVCKTVNRNFDWMNEYSLFSSALKVNPNNAKMWNNVGHSLEALGQFEQALGYFRTAVKVQPNDIGARVNVGRTLVQLKLFDEAEKAYLDALEYFPKPRKGQTYYTRVAPKDLMVFINLANLYSNKTPPQLEDAARLLKRAISLRSDFVDAYQNYGSVLVKLGKYSKAEAIYRKAVQIQRTNPDLIYNLGVVLAETNRSVEAVDCFRQSLSLQPNHLPSMFALASALVESSNPNDRAEGRRFFENLISSNYEVTKVHFTLGMLETDDKNFEKAAMHYRHVIAQEPNHRSALFNLALLLRNELGAIDEPCVLLEHLIKVHPHHLKSYLLLGDIYISEKHQVHLAKEIFAKAAKLDPTNVQAKHNLCIALAEENNLKQSEQCLLEALALDPLASYIHEHLQVVRKRLNA